MNLTALPDYQGLQDLHRQYYGQSGQANHSESNVSSHWKHYGQLFQVTIDDQGNLRNLKGVGFGDYRSERLLWRIANYLCCAIHFLRMDNKRETFRLIKTALSLIKNIPLGHHYLSYDLFRQIHALATIRQHFCVPAQERFTAIFIGDGFGFLAALTKTAYPKASIVLVDMGKTLFFQSLYLQVLFPTCTHLIVKEHVNGEKFQDSKEDFLYCPAEKLEQLHGLKWRLAVNVCSMQEMDKAEIKRYFGYLRAHAEAGSMFYCCNREFKILPDGEKIEFERYPWLETDRHLVDGHSSVYDFYFSTRLKGNGPRLLGRFIPFVDGPDGPIRHRLTLLSMN